MQDHPLITDLESLFRYSGMIDQLRDTSRTLHENGDVTRETLSGMARQYLQLRDALQTTLVGRVCDELERWAPELDPQTVSVDGVYFASAALARYIDLVHQTPKFLVAEEIAGAAAVEMTAKAKASIANIDGLTKPSATGTYL
jgi:hypothetical protein